MSVAPNNLLKFIQREYGDLREEGLVDRFELYHSVENQLTDRIRRWHTSEDVSPEVLAQDIWETAEENASTQFGSGVERYVIHAYRNESNEEDASFAFIVKTKTLAEKHGLATEPATDKGVTAQLMRHLEQQNRLMHEVVSASMNQLVADLNQERTLRRELEATHLDVFKLKEKLLSEQAERDETARRSEAREKRLDELSKMVLPAVGAMGARLLGGKAPGEVKSVLRDQAIGKFLSNLSLEEVQGILTNLSPGNQRSLMELYQSYRDEFQEKKTEANQPAASEPS